MKSFKSSYEGPGDDSSRRRQPVKKSKAAKDFRQEVRHTKAINMAPPPMRGGYRL